MAQTLFGGNATPSLPLLDANFTELYGVVLNTALPVSGGTVQVTNGLAAGRFTSGDTGNRTSVVNTFFDDSTIEMMAGSTSTYTSGVVFAGRNAIVAPGTIRFVTFGLERGRWDASGNFLITGAGGLGYGVGSGGTVTQATSKSTAVTLNKTNGQITMNAASLAAGASVTFTVNNSFFVAGDTVVCHAASAPSGAFNYTVTVYGNGGAIGLTVKNVSAGALAEAVVITFAIIKAAIT